MSDTDKWTETESVHGEEHPADVGRPANSGNSDADLVASEGVNEAGSEDSPGASLGDEESAEPNEPG